MLAPRPIVLFYPDLGQAVLRDPTGGVSSRTRAAKVKVQTDYAKVHKAVKRSIKKDKKDYVSGLAAEAEQAL